jgi:hypothetical protein
VSEAGVQPCYLSLAGALLGALRPFGYEADLTDLLGRSGLAFRMALDRRLGAEALEELPDGELAERLASLGADFRRIACLATASDLAARLGLAWTLLQQALGRGQRPLAFGLDDTPTYALVLQAVDDDHMLVSTQQAPAPHLVDRTALFHASRLDVIVIEPGPRPDPERAPWAGLLALYTQEWGGGGELLYGTAAYRRWGEALAQDEPAAHLQLATVGAELRAHAAAYLRRMAELQPAIQALRGASLSFRQAAALLVELRQLLSGSPTLGPEERADGARLLQEIREAEEEGLDCVHATLRALF